MCIRVYIFNFKNKKRIEIKKKRRKKSKETETEKRIIVKNITGYDYIVCELALYSFKALDEVVNFSWLFI